jgi:hypothetical protein
MITTQVYPETGVGNMLWWLVVTRLIALTHGYDYGILDPENFKGKHFINFDYGHPHFDNPNYYQEKLIRNEYGIDVSPFDSDLWNVKDDTQISGNMQSMKYIEKYKELIAGWLKPEIHYRLEYPKLNENQCLIHFRGGDYAGGPAKAMLPKSYYQNAINCMLQINPKMEFFVVTDDFYTAKHFYFGNSIPIIGSTSTGIPDLDKAPHYMGGRIDVDYMALHTAPNVIMANSTFSFWPVWTNLNVQTVIYPKRWFAFNCPGDFWSTNDMQIEGWHMLDREGNLE